MIGPPADPVSASAPERLQERGSDTGVQELHRVVALDGKVLNESLELQGHRGPLCHGMAHLGLVDARRVSDPVKFVDDLEDFLDQCLIPLPPPLIGPDGPSRQGTACGWRVGVSSGASPNGTAGGSSGIVAVISTVVPFRFGRHVDS